MKQIKQMKTGSPIKSGTTSGESGMTNGEGETVLVRCEQCGALWNLTRGKKMQCACGNVVVGRIAEVKANLTG